MEGKARHTEDSNFLMTIQESWGELSNVNPAVLSCGGIYIPHRGNVPRINYHILTTPNDLEPVKVVTGIRPKNILQKVLAKESMN